MTVMNTTVMVMVVVIVVMIHDANGHIYCLMIEDQDRRNEAK